MKKLSQKNLALIITAAIVALVLIIAAVAFVVYAVTNDIYFDYTTTNLKNYVTLSKYNGFDLNVDIAEPHYEIDIETSKINMLRDDKPTDVWVKNSDGQWIINPGDVVYIWYRGCVIVDGEEVWLDTMTNIRDTYYNKHESTSLEIGSNSFIPGFVDGMIGLVPGEMTEVHVTFPEDYHAENLKGQAVIFEMTVHYIVGNPVLDDAFVASYTEGETTTAEEFTASLRAEMETQLYDSAVRNALWTKIMENAAVTAYPADAVMYYYSYYYTYYNQYATAYGMAYDTFLSYNGLTADYLFEYCKAMVKQDLVRHAVYQAGGYDCTDEQYQELLKEYTDANYDALRSAMIAQGETDYTWEQANAYFHDNYYSQLKDTCIDGIVTEDLANNATITVVEDSAS